jgi:Dipeptidyl aminopeptidases/acylaminoacyl-peptidases
LRHREDGGAGILAEPATLPNRFERDLREEWFMGRQTRRLLQSESSRPGTHTVLDARWQSGGRFEGRQLTSFLPYLELGWNVINIEPRQLGVTLAPATLQNSLCAVRWAMHNAGRYNIDVNKLVFSGASSVRGLRLQEDWVCGRTAGATLPGARGTEIRCGRELVRKLGPCGYSAGTKHEGLRCRLGAWPAESDGTGAHPVAASAPRRRAAVISIHGDADPTVPYTQSVRLHEALQKAGVPQKLVTIPGGKHGGFSREENERAYKEVDAFLKANGLTAR